MRVTGGQFRGRTILAPPGLETRPTSDKTRQSIFNTLSHEVPGASALDVFAGTGAMGIEALSRGAQSATFVERHPKTAQLIERNLAALSLKGEIRQSDWRVALSGLTHEGRTFTLIFVDPPYGEVSADEVISCTITLLAPEGILIIESAPSEEPTTANPLARLLKTRKFGHARISFYCASGDAKRDHDTTERDATSSDIEPTN